MSKVIGIDLGTTNSVVSILESGRAIVLPNAEGAKTTPSVVYYPPEGEVIVGELAKRQRVTEVDRVIYSAKRFMGCRIDEIEAKLEGIDYKIQSDESGKAAIPMGDRLLLPEDVSAEILKKMAETAEAYLGEAVENAVITVPAHFNDSQRQATKKAAELAGLTPLRIINEPTAAALAYGLKNESQQKLAVFDFGGGTFDISILEIDGDIFEVKSTGGDNRLGGDTINDLLNSWICEKIEQETGIGIGNDLQASQRVVEAAEKAKCELSTMQKTLISLPFIVSDASGPKHYSGEITREEFNELIAPMMERLRPPCEMALADAGISREDLTGVVLVGGSTRIPAVQELVKEIFGCEPNCSLNPDEAVACGAAIQSAILSGDLQEILLLDVAPLSLGIELADDVFSTIIPRNSSIPTTVAKNFTTVVDNQSTVKIHVLQGERKIASENRSLDHFKLDDIPPAPKEIPEIEVQFHIDANGIMKVSAMDLTSGVSKEVMVESYAAMTMEVDHEQVIGEADAAHEEDRIHLQISGVKRRAEEMETIIDSFRNRTDGTHVTQKQEQKLKEAFFKLEVALAQKEWAAIEEAERNAKSVFMEVSSMLALQSSGKSGEADLLDISTPNLSEPPPQADVG